MTQCVKCNPLSCAHLHTGSGTCKVYFNAIANYKFLLNEIQFPCYLEIFLSSARIRLKCLVSEWRIWVWEMHLIRLSFCESFKCLSSNDCHLQYKISFQLQSYNESPLQNVKVSLLAPPQHSINHLNQITNVCLYCIV